MLKKILAFGLLFLVGILAVITVTLAADGANNTKVDNCVGLTNGIKITRSGKTSTLVDGCRNAGHGMRNYAMTCVSSKLYRTTWKENCATAVTPTPTAATTTPVTTFTTYQPESSGPNLYFSGHVISDRSYNLSVFANDQSPLYRVEIRDGDNILNYRNYLDNKNKADLLSYSGTVASYGTKRFTARAIDWFGNVSVTTYDLNFIAPVSTTTISATATRGSERDVERVYLTANATASDINEIQIYAGPTAASQFLVERVRYTGHTLASVTASFAKALMPSGYYYARLILRDGSVRDTALQYYSL